MDKIEKIHARQIIDSRGNPTVEVDVFLEDGCMGRAAVPSGASTGSMEAHELRDGDKKYFCGKGVSKAVSNVNEIIAKKLKGFSVSDQRAVDGMLIDISGKNKSKLGANAVLGVSMAVAHAAVNHLGVPLYRHIGGSNAHILPIPMMNIINGGAHAHNPIDIQEFMIMPVGAHTMFDAIRMGCEIFHNLKSILCEQGHNTNIGDEGGFAPNIETAEKALEIISIAVENSGYRLEEDVVYALDAAASEFCSGGEYDLKGEGKSLDSDGMITYYENLINKFPIKSVEDPLAEDDHEGWKEITSRLGDRVNLVGDDLFVTNSEILGKGIREGIANSILIKVNQIGTLTETLDAIELARRNNYNSVISHRSGETEDSTISHIAVGTNSGQIKTGSLSRSDRLAKYNELIRIEEDLAGASNYAGNIRHEFGL